MAGIPPWSQPGTNGGGQRVAVSNRPELEHLNKDQSTTVTAGSTEKVEIYAPTGSIYRLRGMRLQADALTSATTGNQRMSVSTMGSVTLAYGRSDYDSNTTDIGTVKWQYGYWHKATHYEYPPQQLQPTVIQDVQATANSPITVTYTNGSDVDQTGSRIYRLVMEEQSY